MTILDAINDMCQTELEESGGILHYHYWLNGNDKDNAYQKYRTAINKIAQEIKDTK